MEPLSLLPLAIVVTLIAVAGTIIRGKNRAVWSVGPPPQAELHRFLCPHCLCFGLYRHACSGCGSPIDPWVVRTRGQLAGVCTVCRRPLFRRGDQRGPAPLATCSRCGEGCDPTVYHERGVRLVGTLGELDFEAFRQQAGSGWSYRPDHAVFDDGSTLIYVLNLARVDPGGLVDPQHAAANLHAIWFGPSLAEPLQLGERLDQFLRQFPYAESDTFRVFAAPETASSPGANVLSARFPQAEYGIPPERLPEALRPATAAPAVAAPLTLAVLSERDLARLSATTDLKGEPILNRSGQGRCPRLGSLHVVCGERMAEEPGSWPDSKLPKVAAVWIGDAPAAVELLEAQIQGLFRAIGLPHSRAEAMVVCLDDPHPHPATQALLESRFGRVETGVPPQEFLARGPEARGWVLTGRAPVRAYAVLNGTDLWVLSETTEPQHRHDLGGGWFCEATPTRVNYVLNLDAPDRTPGSFFATPDAGEIEAVWIHLAAREPLALAAYLDRMDRIPGLRAAERGDVVACVSHADPPTAVRNVLEARFSRLHYEVSAADFLAGTFQKDEGCRVASNPSGTMA